MAPGYSRGRGYRFSLFLSTSSITLLSPRDLFIFYLFVVPPILRTLLAMAFYRREIAFSFISKTRPQQILFVPRYLVSTQSYRTITVNSCLFPFRLITI